MEKRIVSLILALIMCLNINITASAAVINKPTEHIANVFYFINFNNRGYKFMGGKVSKVKNIFDGAMDSSLSNYIKSISYNKMNVYNYFTQ